jgi:hypothetical protein
MMRKRMGAAACGVAMVAVTASLLGLSSAAQASGPEPVSTPHSIPPPPGGGYALYPSAFWTVENCLAIGRWGQADGEWVLWYCTENTATPRPTWQLWID